MVHTTDIRAENTRNSAYGSPSVQNITTLQCEIEKLKKKELRVKSIIKDEHKLNFSLVLLSLRHLRFVSILSLIISYMKMTRLRFLFSNNNITRRQNSILPISILFL